MPSPQPKIGHDQKEWTPSSLSELHQHECRVKIKVVCAMICFTARHPSYTVPALFTRSVSWHLLAKKQWLWHKIKISKNRSAKWYPQVLKIWNGWNWGTVGKGWWRSEGLKDPCKGITIRISWGYLGLSEKIGEKKLLCIFTKDSSESSCFRVPHPLSLKPMFSNHQKWGAPNNLDAW